MHLPLGMALLELVSFLWLFQTSTHALVQGSKTSPHAPKEDHVILGRTLDWVQRVVIGLKLCPFADKPLKEGKMFLHVVQDEELEAIVSHVLEECHERKYSAGTSLMICPFLFPADYRKFLVVYNIITADLLVQYGFSEDVQIAPFHPLFEFDECSSSASTSSRSNNGIENYVNRSPYPILHIIRTADVHEAAVSLDKDSSRVWKRNGQLLEEMAASFERTRLEELLAGNTPTNEDKAQILAILRKHKIQTKKGPRSA